MVNSFYLSSGDKFFQFIPKCILGDVYLLKYKGLHEGISFQLVIAIKVYET